MARQQSWGDTPAPGAFGHPYCHSPGLFLGSSSVEATWSPCSSQTGQRGPGRAKDCPQAMAGTGWDQAALSQPLLQGTCSTPLWLPFKVKSAGMGGRQL